MRIASNTIILFVRMFILTIINLYAVRLVLKGLGEEDYGIFNTIVGVVTASNVFSGVLALSIQRYFSYAIGQENTQKLQDIFATSMNIFIVLALLLFVLLETVGLWFVYTQLVIPAERLDAVLWIYQFSILILIISMFQIPYTAAIFSHEDMGVYTLISTIECILKFLAAYCIVYATTTDSLVMYVAGLLITSVTVAILYAGVGRRRYGECHYKLPKDKALYRELLSFSGWTLFGSLAGTAMLQGNTILLNIYFGPIIVAAFGIAMQINNAFNALCNSMVLAFRPAMIKAYAGHQYDYLNQLFSVSNKFMFYALIAIGIPLVTYMDDILNIWLGEVTPNIVLFSRCIIVYIICIALHHPITIIMQASGHIKEYHVPVETITLMCLPLTWILFQVNMPSYSVFISMTGISLIAHVVRIYCLKRYYNNFSIRNYTQAFFIPAVIVLLINSYFAIVVNQYVGNTLWQILLSCLYIPVLVALSAYVIGVSREEKSLITSFVKTTISQRICRK